MRSGDLKQISSLQQALCEIEKQIQDIDPTAIQCRADHNVSESSRIMFVRFFIGKLFFKKEILEIKVIYDLIKDSFGEGNLILDKISIDYMESKYYNEIRNKIVLFISQNERLLKGVEIKEVKRF